MLCAPCAHVEVEQPSILQSLWCNNCQNLKVAPRFVYIYSITDFRHAPKKNLDGYSTSRTLYKCKLCRYSAKVSVIISESRCVGHHDIIT